MPNSRSHGTASASVLLAFGVKYIRHHTQVQAKPATPVIKNTHRQPHSAMIAQMAGGAITAPTAVEIRFTADGELTRVDVTHHEADAAMGDRWPERAALFTRAWSHVLPAFAAAIAAANPLDREETR